MNGIVYWLLTTGLCGIGFAASVGYLIFSAGRPREAGGTVGPAARRPWRRRGAVVCAVICVLFHVGIHHVDPQRWPRLFLALWIVVLLLVGWLCLLALADILYTRKLTRESLQRSRRSRF